MKKNFKRFAAMMVALVMVVSMLPVGFAAASRTIVYNLNGATGTPPVDSAVYATSPYRATILNINEGGASVIPPVGKQFAGWSPLVNGIANEWYAPGKQVIVSANGLELYAMWTNVADQYKVMFRTKIAGLTVAPQTVNRDGLVVEPAPISYEGYTFDGWYKDSSFRTKWNFAADKVNSDMMLHAKWQENGIVPWTVTYVMSEGVIGPGPSSTYHGPNGTNARVQNIPADTTYPGKVFAGWSTTPNRVLELKYRTGNNISDYVAVKYEGVKLYDEWVDANRTYPNAVTVDFNKEYQTMAGLGNALAFNKTSGYLQVYKKFNELGVPDAENPAIKAIELAVDDEKGAKLEVFRLIIGDGGVTAPDINPATGEKYEWGNRFYDGPNDTIWPEPGAENIIWNQPNWNMQKDKFDANQIWYVKKALEINPNLKVYGAVWSPPYWMKTNLGVRNDTPDNPNGSPKTTYPLLDDAYFADYAKYLLEYAWGMYAWYGIPIYAVSATNEPEIDHGYSAHVLRGDDYERFLLDYVKPLLEEYKAAGKFSTTPSGAGTGFGAVAPMLTMAGPEGTRIDRSTSPVDMGTPDRPGYGGMMAKPEIQSLVGVFTTHMYENDQFLYEPRFAANNDPIYPTFMNAYSDIWMTEIGQQFPAYNDQNVVDNFSMVNGLFWARRISNQFASEPGFTSYVLWNGTGSAGVSNDTARWVNMLNAGSGQGSLPTITGQLRIYKRFYTTAQFSRFINPGDKRIGADRVPFEGANVTAYKSADGKDFSIVFLNEDKVAHMIPIKLVGNNTTKIIPYRTSDSENVKKLDVIEAVDGVFTVVVPPMSMTTFVNDKGEANLPGLNARDVFTAIEAEDYDAQASVEATDNGVAISAGGYLKYGNFNFADGTGTPSSNVHGLRMIATALPSVNGVLEVRVDSPTGPIVGAFKLTASEDPAVFYAQIDTGDQFAYGVKDIYVVYKGSGSVYLDKFTFDSVIAADATNLVANSTLNSNANNWNGKGTTISSVTTLYYRTRSLRVETGGEDVGAEAALTALPEPGGVYNVKAFFIPAYTMTYSKYTSYDSGLVKGGTAQIKLQYYNGDALVAAQTVASRDDIDNVDWRKVDGTFVYNPPAVEFTTVKLLLTISAETPFHVDEVTLTKAELPKLITSYTDSIVFGYNANVLVKADVADGAVAEIFGKQATFANGVAMIAVAKEDLGTENAAATEIIKIFQNGARLNDDSSVINVIAFNSNIWSAEYVPLGDENKLFVGFQADIAAGPKGIVVTVNGAPKTDVTVSAYSILVENCSLKQGDKIAISGLKYPKLFPSYTFTFSYTMP